MCVGGGSGEGGFPILDMTSTLTFFKEILKKF